MKMDTKQTKETPKKVTLKELIARKHEIEDQKNAKKDLYIKSLDGVITVEKPSRELCIDAMDMGAADGDKYLVYSCVIEPNLKDTELQKAYGCAEPMDIVEKIFESGEITQIAKACVFLAGYGDSVKMVDDIKN
ncbi:hypothetical protein FQB35_04580 [Crassaminicella thermophila]|uniref:Phage XkdN-like tail assembly chaperone protein, TAC n=1 Tax=Crassaminicella thermophila TaxID=2599308 RepID=A0A5C0SD73_CRATE|nr:hypothetical protein [Crassaminicella thermophila]QEK11696.1 hypothetical protein FQB35_04580 [Crassaminicella thermophila]